MTHRRIMNAVCGAVLAVGLTGAVLITRAGERLETANTRADDTLLISSPKAVKRMSLGYSGLVADIYWTRAVQYFGRIHAAHGAGYESLAPILTITTELDPQLTIAYEYGAMFLAQKPPDGAGRPQEAVTLIRRGIEQNPENWHLYYTLGFIYGMELNNYKAAAETFEQGARIPGAHPWMRVVGAGMAAHGGDPETAHYMWTQIYESATEDVLRENAAKHLRTAEVKMDLAQLQKMVDDFRAENGRSPAYLGELVRPGYLFRLPKDPSGRYYRIGADGRVTVQRPADFPFLEPDDKDPITTLAKKTQ